MRLLVILGTCLAPVYAQQKKIKVWRFLQEKQVLHKVCL